MERVPQICLGGDRKRSSTYDDEPWFWSTVGQWGSGLHIQQAAERVRVGFGGAHRQSSSLHRRPSELNIPESPAFPRLLFPAAFPLEQCTARLKLCAGVTPGVLTGRLLSKGQPSCSGTPAAVGDVKVR